MSSLALLLLAACGAAARHGFDARELLEHAAERADARRRLILTSANMQYVDVLINWIVSVDRADAHNWAVVCFDEPLQDFLQTKGLKCLRCTAETHKAIWTARVRMLATLLGAGYDVTLSDADAVWFEDAQPFFDRANSHIVASRGSFPVHLARLWGTTACMGLVHFKSGDATSALVRRMVQRVVVHGDDQRALNEALFDVGVEWPSLMQYVGSSTDALGNATIDGDELRVALLPHDAFVRRCPQTFAFDKGVVVQHCYTAKSGRAKHTILETHGAWFLRNDWLDVYESDPGKWLRQVQRPLAA